MPLAKQLSSTLGKFPLPAREREANKGGHILSNENFNGKAVLDLLVDNVLNTRFEDIGQDVVDNTKRRILDMIGCGIGGSAAPGNAELIDLITDYDGKKEATILGCGVKAPAQEAAMVNCILGRSFDWGPLVLVIDNERHASHTSETTVLTAVTMGEVEKIDGKELITSLIAGDDLVARLHVGAGGGHPGKVADRPTGPPRGGGFEGWGTMTVFGAAAIAGRLMGLNPFQMKHALGIAVNMMSGAGSGLRDGANTFKLSQGTAARSGIFAVQLAKAGWTGNYDPLTAFYSSFTKGCHNPAFVTRDLGKTFYVEVVHKPYPGGRPTNAPTELAIRLAIENDIDSDEIEEAIFRTSPGIATAPHYTKPYKVGYYPTGDALFSFKFAVGNGLATRQSKAENFTEESIRNPRVQSMIDKVKLEMLDRQEGVELEVRMKDGRIFSEYLVMAVGDPSNPLSRDGLVAKFMGQVEFSKFVTKEDAQEVVRMVENLEQVENVADIVQHAAKGS